MAKVVYHCYAGTHSSVVAAAIHLGFLSSRPPRLRELLKVPRFDEDEPRRRGHFFLLGRDSRGNEVYVVGRGGVRGREFERFLQGLKFLTGAEVVSADASSCLNLLAALGGFLSCRLRLKLLGRSLLYLGILLSYREFAALVRDTAERVSALLSSEAHTSPHGPLVVIPDFLPSRPGLFLAGKLLHPGLDATSLRSWMSSFSPSTARLGSLTRLGRWGGRPVWLVGLGRGSPAARRALEGFLLLQATGQHRPGGEA